MSQTNTKPKLNGKSTPKLKLVADKPFAAVSGGNAPEDSMQPGRFVARCQTAAFVQKGSKINAVLVFEVAEGPHAGTQLRQWIPINVINGVVGSNSKFYDHCRLALSRPIQPREDLDPERIFSGVLAVVEVGYALRSADRRSFDAANALKKKYAGDFLRVHRILEVL